MQKGCGYVHHFDYSFLKNGLLPAGFVNLVAEIYKMKTITANQAESITLP